MVSKVKTQARRLDGARRKSEGVVLAHRFSVVVLSVKVYKNLLRTTLERSKHFLRATETHV